LQGVPGSPSSGRQDQALRSQERQNRINV